MDIQYFYAKYWFLQLVHHDFETATRHEIDVTDSIDEAGFTDASGRIDRGILPELQHFIDCCQQGTRPLTDGPSARLSVAVCLAAQESIKRGAMVTLEEILDA